MLKDSQKQKDETVWASKLVLSGYSNNSRADISKIFTCMFPDSKIAKSFELGATKLKYFINFGIAPYFGDILYNHSQKSDCFVIYFDESLNDYAQNCQMDILIRYFDHVENRVKVRYLDSKFLIHATHKDFFIQFTQVIFKLDTKKMFQVSIDGPIVNYKFLEKLQKDCLKNEQHELISTGSCVLHTIHRAFKTGTESTSWNIRKTLHGLYQILHDSPAGRDDFETITASDIYPFNFCATR